MTLEQVRSALDAQVIHAATDFNTIEVQDFIASDLMSDVLMIEADDFALITSLTTEQVVRTADIVGARAIILVNGKAPQPGCLKLAEQEDISILSTGQRTFHCCSRLHDHLEGRTQ